MVVSEHFIYYKREKDLVSAVIIKPIKVINSVRDNLSVKIIHVIVLIIKVGTIIYKIDVDLVFINFN